MNALTHAFIARRRVGKVSYDCWISIVKDHYNIGDNIIRRLIRFTPEIKTLRGLRDRFRIYEFYSNSYPRIKLLLPDDFI